MRDGSVHARVCSPSDLDLAMRTSLASSLVYVHDAAKSQLELDIANCDIAAALDAIRTHRVKPGIFARYYKLVIALELGAIEDARTRFCEIVTLAHDEPAFAVLPFRDDALGAEKAHYVDIIDPDPKGQPLLAAPTREVWSGFPERIAEALKIIQLADGKLASEVRGLVIEVVAAANHAGPSARPLGSASSFMLWGALIINSNRYRKSAELVEALIHECAHQLLFAHSIDEPLVTNSYEERYNSPLRSDPRPMDGVVHATFVTARLHYAFAKIRQATTTEFNPIEPAMLETKLDIFKYKFFAGLEIVQQHAKFTHTGEQIIGEALAYMEAA